jgi:3-hydroxyisobutyrate dehydrogenase-like beta-hydroxyacid dehydrogenase
MSELTIGFVGLGRMGWPMAAHLHAAGFALGLMAKDVRIAHSVIGASGTDAPVLPLADERWARARAQRGPAADQSRAHQSWCDDNLGGD